GLTFSFDGRNQVRALAENGVYPRFFHELLKRGVALAPGPYEILFPGLAHTDAIIDEALEAIQAAALAL
ncbi:MAG: hypothetical protein EX269_03620, partial [Acidimicrobiales bacterium]